MQSLSKRKTDPNCRRTENKEGYGSTRFGKSKGEDDEGEQSIGSLRQKQGWAAGRRGERDGVHLSHFHPLHSLLLSLLQIPFPFRSNSRQSCHPLADPLSAPHLSLQPDSCLCERLRQLRGTRSGRRVHATGGGITCCKQTVRGGLCYSEGRRGEREDGKSLFFASFCFIRRVLFLRLTDDSGLSPQSLTVPCLSLALGWQSGAHTLIPIFSA